MTTVQSEDARLPLWLRLVALAVERGETDVLGSTVAQFTPGQLRVLLGDGLDMPPSSITRAIRLAEARGLLAVGSSARCLRVVPGSLTGSRAS